MPSDLLVGETVCPSDEELAIFAADALTFSQRQRIDEHLRHCPNCAANLEALHAGDQLAIHLRRRCESGAWSNDTPYRELEERACAIAGNATLAATVLGIPLATNGETLPTDFGSYRLLQLLGRGGMGIVYKVEQQSLQRTLALKMVRTGAYASTEERLRFQREAQAIARIDSEHVVRILDFGEHGGQLFFTMELLQGGSLADRLKSASMTPQTAAELTRTLALAVQAAHDRGIVHRDLKPSNVLFAGDGKAKITDFGLAKIFDADSDTRTDVIMGTPEYMSPEQANGEARTLGPAADVYSLGAILYEILCGRPPFRAKTPLQTVDLVRECELEPPSRHRAGLPRDLEAICLKCLEKEPARRYASAASLSDDLGRWLCGEATQVRPPNRLDRAWRAVRRHPRLGAAVVLLAVLTCTTMLAAYRLDPKRPLRNIESRLERGESVVLIGETGKPAWYSFAVGGDATQASTGLDGTFTVHSWAGTFGHSGTLVELLPDPRREKYRLRAEIRHLSGTTSTYVGLYVLHRPFAASQEQAHSLLRWTFDDRHDLRARVAEAHNRFAQKTGKVLRQQIPKGNRVTLHFGLFLDKSASTGINVRCGHDTFEPIIAQNKPPKGQWRRLALEVSPHGVRGFWDGQFSCDLPFLDLTDSVRQSLRQLKKKQANYPIAEKEAVNFSPRGGLGLYVLDGSASFRRVVVEPLEEGK